MRYAPTPGAGAVLVVALLLLLGGRRLQAQQKVLNSRISRPRDDSIRHTLGALVLVMLRAAPAPLIVLAFTLGLDPTVSAEASAISKLFIRLAILLFAFKLMRVVCEPDGIGQVHFRWPQVFVQRTSRLLTSLTRWWLPSMVAAAIAHALSPEGGEEAVRRLLMLVALLVLGYHLVAPQLRELRATGSSWFKSVQNRLRALFAAVVLLALYGIVVGQVFTVMVIISVMINSFCIGVAVLLVHAVLVRWLRVARRKLQLSEFLAQRQEPAADEGVNVEESVPDLVDISAETQQLITFATIVVAAIAVLYIWAPLLPALEGLGRVLLWTSSSVIDGQTVVNSITLETLLTVVALAIVTLYAAKRLPALVELILRSRTDVTPGARYTISTILNYVIIGSGLVAGASALGLQWSELQWLIAALGVGIGFGLQEIVANFISGLIILFERPIRVGDFVTICEKDGVVVRIRIRATTIRDWDGKELLVPNKEFITGRLLNWTLSDSHTRLELPVGIAYGSNVEKALEILDGVVRKHPNVMQAPEPSVLFVGFGDNSLNLVARCYVSRVEDRMPLYSRLHIAINRAFEDAGIAISFPQRDIHFDPDKPLRIALDAPPPSGA
jgi:potassium efflux system protein